MEKDSVIPIYISDVSPKGTFAFGVSPALEGTILIPFNSSMNKIKPIPIFDLGHKLEGLVSLNEAGDYQAREVISYDEGRLTIEGLERIFPFKELKVGRIIEPREGNPYLFARVGTEEVFISAKTFYRGGDFGDLESRDIIRGVIVPATKTHQNRYGRKLSAAFPYFPD